MKVQDSDNFCSVSRQSWGCMLPGMDWISQLNQFGTERRPCLFILDFELKNPVVIPLDDVDPDDIQYNFRGISNSPSHQRIKEVGQLTFQFTPPAFTTYETAFRAVQAEIRYGNSYLLNLTFASAVQTNLNLWDIFHRSRAPYRLWLKNRFVVFSPESFVRIQGNGNEIATFPMKGTLDAGLPDAEQQLIENRKELAEHHTIVDLLRNDLNQVAENVRVERFRYVETIETVRKPLLQTSSEIRGRLPEDWEANLGTIFSRLLPAGSISGAPKEKTVSIIRRVEAQPRGFYTGVCGIYDGENVDTAIMIRFIRQAGERLWFHSGGGITVNSRLEDEYAELVDKVYLPVL